MGLGAPDGLNFHGAGSHFRWQVPNYPTPTCWDGNIENGWNTQICLDNAQFTCPAPSMLCKVMASLDCCKPDPQSWAMPMPTDTNWRAGQFPQSALDVHRMCMSTCDQCGTCANTPM